MFRNKKFGVRTIVFCLIAIVMMFFYSGLQNDHLNVLSGVVMSQYGWSSTQAYLGSNIGSYAAVILYLICGVAFIKVGIRKIFVPSTIVLGIATILLGFSNGNFMFYTICLFLVRACVVPLQMGAFMMCANWYIKYRGRVMGVITAGSPLFSVCGIRVLTWLCSNGITLGYALFGGIVIIMAICMAIFMRDKPEDDGLYPDGLDTAPVSEANEVENVDLSLKQVLSESRGWKLIISYGILQAIISGMMGTMALRYISAGGGEFWAGKAMTWLSIGAICGIPMSYVLGFIDDKLGSIKASLVLNVLYFFAVVPFVVMPWDGSGNVSNALMFCWSFGVACMTGGCPTMHPCITILCIRASFISGS